MKRTLATQESESAPKRSKDGSSSDDEPSLPVRAPGAAAVEVMTAPSGATVSSASEVKPSAPKLASIFQPRSATASTSTNGACSPSSSFKWLDSPGPSKTCLHGVYGDPKLSSKVAFYDLDGTLVRPKGSRMFPSKTDEYDFEFLYTSPRRSGVSVIQQIQQQHAQGFSIVIITNQKQTSTSSSKGLTTWKKKMAHVAAAIDVPLRVFAALADDVYRKPRLGMWNAFLQTNGQVDLEESFYVGDAAGRKKYRDHSDTDLKWALNAGLRFVTPEEYFLGNAMEWVVPVQPWIAANREDGLLKGLVDEPEDEMVTVELSTVAEDSVRRTMLGDQDGSPEIVLFVGPPAAGKTFLYTRVFAPTHVHVNQDHLRTRDKCLRVVADTIEAGRSCVVDNTNRDRATRQHYVQLARQLGVKVRCLYFDVDKATCVHNNHYRAFAAGPGEKRALLPPTAIDSWFRDRQVPSAKEGFAEVVVRVKWAWLGEGEDEEGKRWRMYYH